MLLVVPSFPPDMHGGAERQAAILARAMAGLGVHVTLAHPALTDLPEREVTAYGEARRFRTRHLPADGGRHLGSTLAWTRRVSRWIGKERERFDAVYVFHGRLHALGPVLGARRAGLPVFVKLGGGGEASDFEALRVKRYLYGRMTGAYLRHAVDGWVANSRAIEADLAARGVPPDRVIALPNGVELPPAAAFEAALTRRSGRAFVYAGRLVAEKRAGVLIEATALCVAGGGDPTLTLVGDGPERPRLEALAARLGLADRVRFPGRLEDVYPALLAADAFVSASLREGQSNALLEALSAGLVPIVAGASGAEELVMGGADGALVRDPSPGGLAEAMARVLALTPAERETAARAVRARAERDLSIEAVARRTLGAFEAIMAASPRLRR